jgi:subtilisin family serine protease
MEVGTLYTVALDDGSVSRGWDAVERYEQEQAAIVGKISPLLTSVIRKTSPEEINVVIVLRKQPNIREIVKASEGEVREELDAALSKGEKGKTKKIVSEIRENVTSRSKQFCIAHGQDTVCNYLESINAKIIYRGKLRNHVIAQVPVSALEELGRLPEVQTIEPNLGGIEHLDVSTRAINADDVWPWVEGNTHTGSAGVVNHVSIFDSGIDCSHPALTCYGSWNYVSGDEATTDDLQGHGTHVAGIVASQDSTYTGVAPGVYLLNEKIAYRTNGGAYSPWAAVYPALEHSYGPGWSEIVQYSYGWYPPSTGDDYYTWTQGNTEISKTFDAYVEAGLTCIISAGNEGSSYSTISVPGDAFNVITVGNFDDQNTVSRSDDDVWWSSSRGYTGDGRTKPDVAAPGAYIMSTNAFWETQPDFITFTGTSMAAPHVAGIAALEIDEWARLYSERLSGKYFVYGGPLTIRAMIYNSADETTGEFSSAQNDRTSGTGYVDAYEAWDQAWKPTVKIISLTGTNGAYYSIDVNPGDTIKATIAWNRHVDLSTITPKTVSDIDLELRDLSGTVLAGSWDAQTNWEKIAYTYTGASPTTLRIHVYPCASVPADVATETIALACSHLLQSPEDDTVAFRNGWWYVSKQDHTGTDWTKTFVYGVAGDKPVIGDIDNNGVVDAVIFRNGLWYVSKEDHTGTDWTKTFSYGIPGDKPVIGQ